ncbi:hypothetical protein BDV59DRAFT_85641 [Aspergillus ambiguus]|uniref:uncharacterized protein n=1 Tax=Aspergillus ambiguus TaxID=176160 RepID=UPI003CCC956E
MAESGLTIHQTPPPPPSDHRLAAVITNFAALHLFSYIAFPLAMQPLFGLMAPSGPPVCMGTRSMTFFR